MAAVKTHHAIPIIPETAMHDRLPFRLAIPPSPVNKGLDKRTGEASFHERFRRTYGVREDLRETPAQDTTPPGRKGDACSLRLALDTCERCRDVVDAAMTPVLNQLGVLFRGRPRAPIRIDPRSPGPLSSRFPHRISPRPP